MMHGSSSSYTGKTVEADMKIPYYCKGFGLSCAIFAVIVRPPHEIKAPCTENTVQVFKNKP